MVRRVALSAAFAAAWVAYGSSQAARSVPPNVLLVTIDTLRADHVGAWGYTGAHTPTLDGLARSGVRFADATAHAPLTYPSHAAILTGRYPASLGIRLNGMDPLPERVPTIATRFKERGYRTGAVVASVILSRAAGLTAGFDDYDDAVPQKAGETVALADLQRPAGSVTTAAIDWLAAGASASAQRPWFLWVHYYDPHLPYDAPAKYTALTPGHPYDAEIAYADAELGRLLQKVDLANTIVGVTADHGESLGDHGEPDHGFFLYDATLHVPLIVAGKGVQPRVVSEQVRSIDVTPTLLALAGLPPLGGAQGESVVGLLNGAPRKDVPLSLGESQYPRLHFGWSELRSARVGEWKYVAAPEPELYDLRTDPKEQRNVVRDRQTVAGRLAAELSNVVSTFGTKELSHAQPDEATRQRLEALGYVGSLAPAPAGTGDDPKKHIDDYVAYRELFNRALSLLGRDQPQQAAAVLKQLLKKNVRSFEAHLYLGNAYAAMNDAQTALGEYDAASLLNPELATPHFEAAKVLARSGQLQAAADRCRKGLALEPQSAYGYYTLGVTEAQASRWRAAADAFTRAIALSPTEPRAHAGLAQASLRLNDLPTAAAQFEAMIDLKFQIAPAQFNLGIMGARRGDTVEAARRYRLALAADPNFAPARDALARLRTPR